MKAAGWCVLCALSPSLGWAHTYVRLLDAYGTPENFVVRGRVVEDSPVKPPKKGAGPLRNLKHAVESLGTDGLPGVSVNVEVVGLTRAVVTNGEGTFEAAFVDVKPMPPAGVLTAHVKVMQGTEVTAQAEGPVYVVADDDGVILVSDVDDTVVQTNIRSKRKLVGTVLFKNAAQLEPVPGTPQAYRDAVTAGLRAVIYLSGSPEGFHDRIRDFLRLQGFPDGPVLLKDFSRDSPTQQQSYKRTRLAALAARFPKARFVLVGDSGEKDPEIYRAFSAEYPGRVVGIVIRQTPAAPAGRERLTDCRVLQDHQEQPELLSGIVKAAGTH